MRIEEAVKKSSIVFEELVRPHYPELEPFVMTEGDEEYKENDMKYKIDGLCMYQGIIKPLAIRIQIYTSDDNSTPRNRKNWRTFTVRKARQRANGSWNSEIGYTVIKRHIEQNLPYPEIMIHSYVLDGVLLGSGCAFTKDVIDWITSRGPSAPWRVMKNKGPYVMFYYVSYNGVDMIKEV